MSVTAEAAVVRIGVLVPLSPPGWVEAGRHLLAGLELATRDLNAAGGVAGRRVELVVRDTAADPGRAAAAVDEFAASGVSAVAGEYHSVAARGAAARADAHGLPFLCSSAVLDALTERPSRWVARLAPTQSHGWRIFAELLLAAGHRRVVLATQPSLYWEAGAQILQHQLTSRGGKVVRLDVSEQPPGQVREVLLDADATALLLLVGYPEPALSLVRAVRGDPRLSHVLLGAPAGQPEFRSWAEVLGRDGARIPFLRYLPEHLTPLGERVERRLLSRLSEPVSFVAFEGYDTMLVLAEMLGARSAGPDDAPWTWSDVAAEGTRGRIRFATAADALVAQWTWPPVQVVERDAEGGLRTLRTG